MSGNDVVTALLSAAAVAVPIVALIISYHTDQRAARSTLTDLARTVNRKTSAYSAVNDDSKYAAMNEIELLVRQAEFVMDRLTSRYLKRASYPEPRIAATLAQALEAVGDSWWADTMWGRATASKAQDAYSRASIVGYWGAALCGRKQYQRARSLVDGELAKLPSVTADACIVKADVYVLMASFDKKMSYYWLNKVRAEYCAIPENDERREVYVVDGNPILTLTSLDLSCANLASANLRSAYLDNVNFTGADLTGADLTGADLSGANLNSADLRGTILASADLSDADLTDGRLNPDDAVPDAWVRDPDSGLLRRPPDETPATMAQ